MASVYSSYEVILRTFDFFDASIIETQATRAATTRPPSTRRAGVEERLNTIIVPRMGRSNNEQETLGETSLVVSRREGAREGAREGGSEGAREGGSEGARERGSEGAREGARERGR